MAKLDYRAPDYAAVFADRARRLQRLRDDPKLLAGVKKHYRTHPWDFINDWGMTFEPRNIELDRIPAIPFILWGRQVQYLQWLQARWRARERGLVEKSRDCGLTWLSVGFAVSMWLFEDGFVTGFGSRKEELIDRRGDEKSIFEKIRYFLDNVPAEFLPAGFDARLHSAHMKLVHPTSGARIIGEAGDEIGRGGRASMYFVDEAGFIDQQPRVDAALSMTTNCQIDISTPNGSGNLFYKKRMKFNNTDKVFVFDWKDDPRKDDAWYQKLRRELDDVTVAQEIDRDYNASQEDAFIPAPWIAACIDAHVKLGFTMEGLRVTGFDPADVGDAKAVVNRYGSVILEADQLTRGDITQAIPWAYDIADAFRADVLAYDGDGMGAPVMKMAFARRSAERLRLVAYRGSAAVVDPRKLYGDDRIIRGRNREKRQATALEFNLKTNQDTFENFRAQTWTWFRDRCKATFDAIQRLNEGKLVLMTSDMECLLSISSNCKRLTELQSELSRPKRIFTANGKIKVESKAEMKSRGVGSPNLADAAIIAFSVFARIERPQRPPMNFVEWTESVPGLGM